MLKVLILAAIVAGCAANFGHFKKRHHRRFFEDDEETAGVRPPNCNCTKEEHKDKSLELWKYKHEDWIVKNLRGNDTLESLKQKWKLKKQICGNNNVTYESKCEYTNAAAKDSNLGIRCHGPCPCGDEEEEHEFKSHRRHFMIQKAYCLTNGQTVYGKNELKAAKKANPSVGKRCHGECADCANDLRCPKRRHRNRRESPVVAPNCVCTQKSSHRYQKFLNTTCGQKHLEKKMICGSDNVTYANKCDFKNKQVANPALGKRCHGKCPCDLEKFGRKHHMFKRNAGFGWEKREEKRGLHKYHKEAEPFCLNNGQTVHGKIEKHEALKKNESLGVRCKGECSECQTAPIHCPIDYVKEKEDKEKARPHPPNCTCPEALSMGFKRRHLEVCGNDNKTYSNICELINNQTTNPKLGFRCLGKCPCTNEIKGDFKNPFEEENENPQAQGENQQPEQVDESAAGSSNASSNATVEPKAIIFAVGSANISGSNSTNSTVDATAESFTQEPEAENPEANENEDREGKADEPEGAEEPEGLEDQPERQPRHFGFGRRRHHRRRRHHKPICLTNGNTVRKWREVSKAFAADPTLGIRCKGDCDDCFNNTKCPRFPSAEKIERIKQRRETKAKEWRHWYMEATTESPEHPPNCTCPFGPNHKVMVHEGAWKHHRKGGEKNKFELCGSNNVTYKNLCELTNAQAQNAGLGSRCFGACPCKADEFDLSNIKEDNKTKNYSICLTNGKTVHSKREKYEALAADATLGVRCMNECSICQNDIKCPRIFKPKNETEKRQFGWGHRGGDKGQENEKDGGEERGRWRRHKFGMGRSDEAMTADNQTNANETEAKSYWEIKKEQPFFQFGKAFDFGFEEKGFGHHKGWGHKGWGHKGWGPKGWGHKGWGQHKGWGNKGWGNKGWGNKGWGNKGWGNKGWGHKEAQAEDCEY
ncbi:uncharacterized protein LOC129592352 [Paramacrobiotus metropolitanus]|uniref:uncharacterized protein LOC129592352 n=1 Tax=Paramacrobiotus metropolitanus TaxID=2943436 RepID=UPI00244592AD|nr:uncharacterized protein LOC129592352 [Paramacrobiotus metropolitanus]